MADKRHKPSETVSGDEVQAPGLNEVINEQDSSDVQRGMHEILL